MEFSTCRESRALCVGSRPRTTSHRQHQRDLKAGQVWAMLPELEDLALGGGGRGGAAHNMAKTGYEKMTMNHLQNSF